jgi:hypothetical protein
MNLLVLVLVGLFSATAFADGVDPRIIDAMRIERNATQRFCQTFAQEPIGNGLVVAQTCLATVQGRYLGNFRLAKKDPKAFETEATTSKSQAEFCWAIGEYTRPGPWVAADCLAWNRSRSELFKLATTDGTPEAVLDAKIRAVEESRRRFCISVQNAGFQGSAEIYWARVNACFTFAVNSTVSDRAIILSEFP